MITELELYSLELQFYGLYFIQCILNRDTKGILKNTLRKIIRIGLTNP